MKLDRLERILFFSEILLFKTEIEPRYIPASVFKEITYSRIETRYHHSNFRIVGITSIDSLRVKSPDIQEHALKFSFLKPPQCFDSIAVYDIFVPLPVFSREMHKDGMYYFGTPIKSADYVYRQLMVEFQKKLFGDFN